jgi:hypothetical protein
MKKKLRILFAGGCHVLGFPVGVEFAFPKVVLKALAEEYQCESKSVGYLSFGRSHLLLDAYREFDPDLLVLQLGHYECPRALEKILKKSTLARLLRSPSASNSSSSSNGLEGPVYTPDPRSAFKSSWKWRLRSTIRLAVGLAYEWKGEPVFARKKVSDDLSDLLKAIRDNGHCRIVLLSPFLCPDYMVRHYRRRAWKIFSDASRRHDSLFVDSQQVLLNLERSREDLSLYANGDHLSATGHEAVGRHLADQIRAMLALRAMSGAQLAVTPSRLATSLSSEYMPSIRP